jgi:hypothetical protein
MDQRGHGQAGSRGPAPGSRGWQQDSYGGLQDKNTDQNLSSNQKRKQDDLFAQPKGKQVDLFAQKGKQEDLFAQRGAPQVDLFAGRSNNPTPEPSLRVEEKSYDGSRRQFAGEDSAQRDKTDNNFAEFSSNNERGYARPWNSDQVDAAGDVELHGEHELGHNPAIQTMMNMVTMLNFMKVSIFLAKMLASVTDIHPSRSF